MPIRYKTSRLPQSDLPTVVTIAPPAAPTDRTPSVFDRTAYDDRPLGEKYAGFFENLARLARLGGAFASAPGGSIGAALAGGGEAIGQVLEGLGKLPQLPGAIRDIITTSTPGARASQVGGFLVGGTTPAARIGVEAGIGAIPAASLLTGRALSSALRTGAISGIGETGREIARGEPLSPGAIGGASILGALVGGLLSPFAPRTYGQTQPPFEWRQGPPKKYPTREAYRAARATALPPPYRALTSKELEEQAAKKVGELPVGPLRSDLDRVMVQRAKDIIAQRQAEVRQAEQLAKRIEKILATRAKEAEEARKHQEILSAIENVGAEPQTPTFSEALSAKTPQGGRLSQRTTYKVPREEDTEATELMKSMEPPVEPPPPPPSPAPPQTVTAPSSPAELNRLLGGSRQINIDRLRQALHPDQRDIFDAWLQVGRPVRYAFQKASAYTAPVRQSDGSIKAVPIGLPVKTAPVTPVEETTFFGPSPEPPTKLPPQVEPLVEKLQKTLTPTPRAPELPPVVEELQKPTPLITNASEESAASAEALSRQAGMQARGEQYVVYDRAGRQRPLIGPEAVDYKPAQGEVYGIEGPGGFRILEDRGGRPPTAEWISPNISPEARAKLQVAEQTFQPEALAELQRLHRLYNTPGLDKAVKKQAGKELKELHEFMTGTGRFAASSTPKTPSPAQSLETVAELERLDQALQAAQQSTALDDLAKFEALQREWDEYWKTQKGEASPALLLKALLGLGGGLTGAALTPEHPFLGALGGATAGLGIGFAPELMRLPAGARAKDALHQIYARIPQMMRFQYLIGPPAPVYNQAGELRPPYFNPGGLIANAIGGPYGSLLTGGLEEFLAGNPQGRELLLRGGSPVSFVKRMFQPSTIGRAVQLLAKGELGRAEGLGAPISGPISKKFTEITSWPAVYMTAGDETARQFMREAGFSEPVAREMTLTNEARAPFIRTLQNAGKGDPFWGPLTEMQFLFRRTPLNILEQGVPRLPLFGALLQLAQKNPDYQRILAQQLLAGGTGGLGFAAGATLPPEQARWVRRYLTNLSGRYSLGTGAAFTLGQMMNPQDIIPPEQRLAYGIENLFPLPTAEPIAETAKFVGGLTGLTAPAPPPSSVIPVLGIPEFKQVAEKAGWIRSPGMVRLRVRPRRQRRSS